MKTPALWPNSNGKIVGYLISYTLIGGFGIAKSAWVANIGVNPKFMGQGIGEKLAEEIFKYYRNKKIKDIYTSVMWDSTDLLSFLKPSVLTGANS